jgi:hypothetical protein
MIKQNHKEIKRNIEYAQAAMLDCLRKHNEAPFASHLLYTQVLDDKVKEDRALGIEAGLLWGAQAEKTVIYIDLGVTEGMRQGIARARKEGRPVENREIEGWS